jgi:hypothetical protein
MHQVQQWILGIPAVARVDVRWYPTCEALVHLKAGASVTREELDWAVRRAGFATLAIEELAREESRD